ncbi:MAG: hypothetical protein N3B18_13180 [Desulfobacterota bacterium]|nr:hypothetical protein [Thermodesulfobacteriota bacterium]
MRNPLTPSLMTSHTPSTAFATTGSPAAIACGITRGSPSHNDVKMNTSMQRSSAGTSCRDPGNFITSTSPSSARRRSTSGRSAPSPINRN